MALALQSDLAEKFIARIGEIGSIRRLAAVRHKKEPRQAHGVVDAQQARITHIGGKDFRQAGPTAPGAGERIGCGQVPDLTRRREGVGRRANADALG